MSPNGSQSSPSDGALPSLDELIPLSRVPAVIEPVIGKRLHRSAIERWVRDHGLQAVRVSRRLCTTQQWLMAFFADRAESTGDMETRSSSARMSRRKAATGARKRRDSAHDTEAVLRRFRVSNGGRDGG